MKNRKAIIFGIRGTKLTFREKRLLKNGKPWGIILFSRNIKNIKQTKDLLDQIKKIFKDKKYPILIDEEGGKVNRLKNIINLDNFNQKYFGDFFVKDDKKFKIKYKAYIDLISYILNYMGININTVPVLDIIKKNSHKIISNRSFSKNKKVVSKLGQLCIKFYKSNKIATVIKHIPGHGSAKVDSHYFTPIVKNSKKNLIANDFAPFKKCKSFFAMTAHVIFNSYDNRNTATHSKTIIKSLIRKKLGFKGILISDDIAMEALKFNIITNATKALKAGCNLVLHCNANIRQMERLIKVIPNIDTFTYKKTSDFYKFLG